MQSGWSETAERAPSRTVNLLVVECKIGMTQQRSVQKSALNLVLARARALAEQVRETAERVHQQAKEAHRLTEIARRQAERGRELSKAGREEAQAVADSIKWGVNVVGNGKRRAPGNDDA